MNTYNRSSQDKLIHILTVISLFKLGKKDIIPSTNFITALGIVLSGIGHTSKSKQSQYLQEHLSRFSTTNSLNRQLISLIAEYIQEIKTEKISSKLLNFQLCISQSEKALIVAYTYRVLKTNSQYTQYSVEYIKNIVELFQLDSTYIDEIESKLNSQSNDLDASLEKVKELLSPINFQHLNISVSNVAADLVLFIEKCQKEQPDIEASYEHLQQYQKSCEQLDNYCYELYQILDECHQKKLISDAFVTEIGAISRQLQSQNFRVAVVGEFSQGKSTLLNALLREEIQPVRAIPCSGTVTVLKYGEQKRVICRYKDGREEEIPIEKYQEKAAISEEAALDGVSDELATSSIKEIVFEHPDLELCRHGVEIVDSPGLNEHPERSAITEQLIKDTDAVIFLTNASRPLTQGERELINDFKTKLNGGDNHKAANNLFIVVNFMDLLRRETDRASVRKRIERFAYNNNSVITGENRIHFISAQAALDAIQQGYEDEYLSSFHDLTKSIETFLTNEIGSIKLNHNVNKVKGLIQSFQKHQQEEKQDILEQIGIISSWDVELYQLATLLEEEVINEAVDSWNEWIEKLADRVYYESESWTSTPEDETKILKFFSYKLHNAIMNELNNWLKDAVKQKILKTKFELINSEIELIIEALQHLFEELDDEAGTNIKRQIELSISQQQIRLNIDSSSFDDNDGDGAGFGIGLGGAGLIGAGLLAFTGIGLVPIALAALGSGFGLGALFGESKQDKIKRIVLEKGLEQFYESQQETFDKISEQITSAFENKIKLSSQLIKEAICILENIIAMQDELMEHNQTISKVDHKINVLIEAKT